MSSSYHEVYRAKSGPLILSRREQEKIDQRIKSRQGGKKGSGRSSKSGTPIIRPRGK